jgi:DNA ligase-associated metallophosphoesterase
MKIATANINGNEFILHPLKAAYWVEQKALLIADLHFGKVTHFRKAGIAVPREKINEDVIKLHRLMEEFKPLKVYFLGDLFHSEYNREIKLLEEFIDNYPKVNFVLITGNHDLPGFLRCIESRVEILEETTIDEFILQHKPSEPANSKYQICGHLHPAAKLRGPSKQYLKLPCFYVTNTMMILPSFGSFTGSKAISPKKGDRVFVVTDMEVIEVE